MSLYPEFTTPRLKFRQFNINDDIEPVYQLFSDPETMRFDGGELMASRDEARDLIQAFSSFQAPAVRWAVVLRENNQFLGSCGYHHIDHYNQKAELGGELIRQYWRLGFAREGLFELLRFGFERMNFNRIEAWISPENRAAIRTIKCVPFQEEGYLRQCQRWGNHFVDMKIYSLIRRDWDMFHEQIKFSEPL
ncbi:GNAT family N-acetyltransferase [Terrilactibacillus laevilacticus]|uniref:GNAT family N-acetyltransferase n=1 Tax=Terrilactibacillus laevilacticus TaxID=1380157 RepID=A0ABW5PPI3_9BACI|nr:GNAT family N-acetyltransferase [Terrilactibacillus laevilacticus]